MDNRNVSEAFHREPAERLGRRDTNLVALASHIRQLTVTSIYHAGSGHPGGSLSAADLLATLYGWELNLEKTDIECDDRDRFVLSKGHACPALYSAWAARGFISQQSVTTLRKLGSPLQGHPHVIDMPLAETSTGSLGQGFSTAVGMALGLRHKGSTARVYAMLGDGELQEGQVWEAAMSASHHDVDNLCAIIDYNNLQSDDRNENIMSLEPLAVRWRSFGWNALEIDGHDLDDIKNAFEAARSTSGIPTVIIAHTIKGKGVSYMEDSAPWHGSVKLSTDDVSRALQDLSLDNATAQDWIDGIIN